MSANCPSRGGNNYEGENVEQVETLKTKDFVCVNQNRLIQLTRQLGDKDAADMVCRAMEELTTRLTQVHDHFQRDQLKDMRKCARSIVAIADQIGLETLTLVADDVLECIDAKDGVALAATHARLLRIGDRSLTELWELQGLPD